jgi:hypothetical protein
VRGNLRSRLSPLGLGVLLLAACGCSHAATETGAALGERFALAPGESVSIGGEPVTITFERIVSDNRCAIDVVCIVAGEARASFRWKRRGRPADSFELDTDRNSTTVVGDSRVTLLAVSPAPRSTVRIDPGAYRVELVVSRSLDPSKGSSPPS